MDLTPFDIDKAKAGEPVITREGRPVKILCFDRKHNTPIVGLITRNNGAILTDILCSWDRRGFVYSGVLPDCNDLFHPPDEMWVNVVLRKTLFGHKLAMPRIFKSKQDAKDHPAGNWEGTLREQYRLVKE